MNRPTLRTAILQRSVQSQLGADETVNGVAVLFTRHRWFWPYSIVAGIGIGIISGMTGITGSFSLLVMALCGGAIAGLSTTNYWVLASTDESLVLLRSSRIRQFAKGIVKRLPTSEPLEMVGSTVVTSDWRIDGIMYTATKRWEAALRIMSMG